MMRTPRRGSRAAGLLLLVLPLGHLLSCMRPVIEVPASLSACDAAIAEANASSDKESRNDALLYYLRLGMYQHACRRFG